MSSSMLSKEFLLVLGKIEVYHWKESFFFFFFFIERQADRIIS